MNEVQGTQATIAPVKKSIRVALPVEDAFHLFTSEMASWWPLLTHSVGGEDAQACGMEEKAGGRVYEVIKGGRQVEWGRVVTWEPPSRLVLAWYPGRTSETAQEVEITFTSEGEGARMELVHRGWEILGERAIELRESYDTGWDTVLGKYAVGASRRTSILSVVQSVSVSLTVEAAFRLFTEEINRWWPLATHSVGGERVERCILERRTGGRFYEVQSDGSQAEWGQVLTWEPPDRLVFTLHPGQAPEAAGEVEVTFRPEGGGTQITLVHSGWERLGEGARAMRDGYDRGWVHILRRFSELAGRPYSSNKNVASA
jgi:uncharacterized protein YndB with AHSA1/START domain